MNDAKGSPDEYATERRKMSHMMIESAENDATSDNTGAQEPQKNEYLETVQTPASVNKPLAMIYPEIADDKDEKLFADVRRHWLGRFGIIFTGSFLIVLLLGFMVAIPSLIRGVGYSATGELKAILAIIVLIIAVLIAIGTFITLWVYNHSRMLITNENVIEVRQLSLFSKKVSHLNMLNVEDVTVTKHGILQTAFNYGTLQIETAGEKDNFSFPNTPIPDVYRKMVINAHEAMIERIGQMGSVQRVELSHNGL